METSAPAQYRKRLGLTKSDDLYSHNLYNPSKHVVWMSFLTCFQEEISTKMTRMELNEYEKTHYATIAAPGTSKSLKIMYCVTQFVS